MNAVLDLVNALRNQKLIPIVAASRVVELQSDIRLGALLESREGKYTVKRIDLSLLDIEAVVSELSAIRINAADWPSSSVEFLQTPYHLAAYIESLGNISGKHQRNSTTSFKLTPITARDPLEIASVRS